MFIIGEDHSGIGLLLREEGLIGSPTFIFDISWPMIDADLWKFSDSSVIILYILENQSIVEFPDARFYQLTMKSEIGVCPFYITIQLRIVSSEEEFNQPASIEDLGT